MDTIINKLTGIVAAAFEGCGYDKSLGKVIVSNRPDLCDFQCDGALKGAKQYKKAPFVIAEEVADAIKANPEAERVFKEIEMVKPGFLNLTLSDEAIITYANGMIEDQELGITKTDKKETIIIDYGGPNIAKPLHIGHLRSAIIGESLKRLMRKLGYNVIGDVHLGDWGLQMGLVIAELSERFPEYSCFTGDYKEGDPLPEVTADELGELYPFASSKSKTDKAFSEKAHNLTFELQKGTPGYIAMWKKIWDISVSDLKGNYSKLNVDFDLWYGESDADKYIPEIINILENKGILEESDGAKIVSVVEETDKRPMPPAIIFKSDGAVNYETTDIATIYQRHQDFSPEKIWYVVDNRQELHFTQVFRVCKKAGIIPEETELLHLGFGTMNGKDGKPYKTRDGGVMRLADMIETAIVSAGGKISNSAYVESGSENEVARKIGIAAIKFGDLINHRTKDYIFDMDRFVSFEGKTGPYILYMIARINSLITKSGEANGGAGKGGKLSGIYSEEERALLLRLIGTSDVLWTAAREKAPNYVCENAYQIASVFSQFYHNNHIIAEENAEKKQSWINICSFVKSLLELHLDILGMDTVEFM